MVAHVVKVGKHEQEILADRDATGLTLEDPKPADRYGGGGSSNNMGCIIAVIVVVIIIYAIMQAG